MYFRCWKRNLPQYFKLLGKNIKSSLNSLCHQPKKPNEIPFNLTAQTRPQTRLHRKTILLNEFYKLPQTSKIMDPELETKPRVWHTKNPLDSTHIQTTAANRPIDVLQPRPYELLHDISFEL